MITPIPTEFSTAVTDLLLAIIVFILAAAIKTNQGKKQTRAGIWRYLFILVAAGAFFGSIAHGLVLPEMINKIVWWVVYLLLDLSIVLFALAVLYDCFASMKGLSILILLAIICYLPLVVYESFTIFIIYQLVVMISALLIYGYLAFKNRLLGAKLICSGIFVMIVGAILQSIKSIEFTLVWTFDYNSIYHFISMVGMLLIFCGLKSDLNNKE